ncbi:hypothetical protein [Burkholderia pyrrocinia]|uniref:hypothetical protein n=1 Tax=Burkholderia pyrrocinia TaxID=60550 RepID=UPI0015890C6B|nr:hypothetical protein [Burkholderia pyrrocinia]
MDIDELLTVEERKDDGTGSLKTGWPRGVRCAGAYLRAINGTLRAAAPIRLRTGRAWFAAQTARERNWNSCRATPGRGTGVGPTMERRATPMQFGELRPAEIMRQAMPAARCPFVGTNAPDRRGYRRSAAMRVSGFRYARAMPDSDFSARRLAARHRHPILMAWTKRSYRVIAQPAIEPACGSGAGDQP